MFSLYKKLHLPKRVSDMPVWERLWKKDFLNWVFIEVTYGHCAEVEAVLEHFI